MKSIDISLTLLVLIWFVVGIPVIAVYAKNHRNKALFVSVVMIVIFIIYFKFRSS